jgi:hypothetical protein
VSFHQRRSPGRYASGPPFRHLAGTTRAALPGRAEPDVPARGAFRAGRPLNPRRRRTGERRHVPEVYLLTAGWGCVF